MYRLKNMNIEFTGSERVLFNMAYEFAINVEKLTEFEACQRGMDKVLSKRAMSNKLRRSEYGHQNRKGISRASIYSTNDCNSSSMHITGMDQIIYSMKEIVNTLKANPLEALAATAVVTGIFTAFYIVIWVGSAIGLQ